jgi:hypothetical protein
LGGGRVAQFFLLDRFWLQVGVCAYLPFVKALSLSLFLVKKIVIY